VLAFCLQAASVHAEPSRGVWFWSDPESPHGTHRVVGDPVAEETALAQLKRWEIKRVYGAYGDRPKTAPAVIARWNQKLHQAGLISMLLISENSWIFPEKRPRLLERLQQNLLDFNRTQASPQARFDAVHLDIEPHALSEWKSSTPIEKRRYLRHLRDTFAEARRYLDSRGGADIPLYADLAVWYDDVNVIGWDTRAERDQWFKDIAGSLAGVTVMAYERRDLAAIEQDIALERAFFGPRMTIGLNADIGSGLTWPDFAGFLRMINRVETVYGTGVDIESYSSFMSAIPSDYSSTPSQLKRLVVLDIELTGDLGGSRFEAEHEQRMRTVSTRLRDGLKQSHLYNVVDNAPAETLISRLKSERYLYRCNSCALDIARQLDAEQVLVPWIYRVSNLILTLNVEILDAATGRRIMKKALDFRGDNDRGWMSAVDYLIRDMKEQRG